MAPIFHGTVPLSRFANAKLKFIISSETQNFLELGPQAVARNLKAQFVILELIAACSVDYLELSVNTGRNFAQSYMTHANYMFRFAHVKLNCGRINLHSRWI